MNNCNREGGKNVTVTLNRHSTTYSHSLMITIMIVIHECIFALHPFLQISSFNFNGNGNFRLSSSEEE